MVLAFFTAPITSLGSFGFGKSATSSDSTSDANLRPESLSAGAIIKCNDCGGDVVLAELGEHICKQFILEKEENDIVNEAAPLSQAKKTTGTAASPKRRTHQPLKDLSTELQAVPIASLNENISKSPESDHKRPDNSSSRSYPIKMSPPSTKNSSEFSLSHSEASSSSTSSTGRTPFFEKYAQMMPNATKITSKSPLKIPSQGRDKLEFSSRKDLSPITTPEPSPPGKVGEVSHSSKGKLPSSKSAPFSNFPELGLASQRREAANRRLQEEQNQVTSASYPNELENPRSAQQEFSSSTADVVRLQQSRAVESGPKLSVSRTPKKDAWNSRSTHGGLEDLMGDLMAEMEKKAELTSEEYQSTMSRRAPIKPIVPMLSHSTERLKPQAKIEGRSLRRAEPEVHPDDTPKSHSRPPIGSNPSSDSPTPSSPGIKPSDSISQLGFNRSPSPKLIRGLIPAVQDSSKLCQRCGESPIGHVKDPTRDEARFCRKCYAELYLPKCRKCSKPIERGAVTDRVGKVLGKYHLNCFNCFQCAAPFPNGEFYVWERKPVCSKHYHRLAGTICCNESCGQGIEGPCVSLLLEGSSAGSVLSDDSSHSNTISNSSRRKLYHPEHFTCSRRGCPNSLHEFHFVLNGKPWCEHHVLQEQEQLPRTMWPNRLAPRDENPSYGRDLAGLQPSGRTRRVERRRTIIQNVRNR